MTALAYAGPTLRELGDQMRALARKGAKGDAVPLAFVEDLVGDLEVRIAGEIGARVVAATNTAVDQGDGLATAAQLAAQVRAFLRGLRP